MMNQLCVFLFGKFAVTYNDEVTNNFHVNKAQELFSYLMIQRQPHTRDALAELLWSNAPSHRSKGYLRKVLWQLQTTLSIFTNPDEPFLSIQTDCIHLNPKADLWLDVAVFENTFNHVRRTAGQQLESYQVHELETAVTLYEGDLLEGWYQEWCLYERERFQQMLLSMLDKLIEHSEVSGEYETGLAYGERALFYDPARERTHCGLMRLHYLNGDRTQALRQYERCTTVLKKELDVPPAEQTNTLYHQIRHGHPIHLPVPPPAASSTPHPLPLMEVLDHLKQLRANLVSMQHQVDMEIDIVEKYLHPKEP